MGMRIQPSADEMDKVLIIARDHFVLNLLVAYGYEETDEVVPDDIAVATMEDTILHLDIEAIMPEHWARLMAIRNELLALNVEAINPEGSIASRSTATSNIQTILRADPWKKNLLYDLQSYLVDEFEYIVENFKARVNIPGRKVT